MLNAIFMLVGWRWIPSAIMPKYGRGGVRDAVPRTPKIPGLRWWSGFIALNRCVIMLAPESTARLACS